MPHFLSCWNSILVVVRSFLEKLFLTTPKFRQMIKLTMMNIERFFAVSNASIFYDDSVDDDVRCIINNPPFGSFLC
jgi:hypothetical protein